MKIGILNLSLNDVYLDEDGNLPPRQPFDKGLLLSLLKDNTYVCSDNTFETLPNSIKSIATRVKSKDYDVNLGIETLEINPPDILLIIRSNSFLRGKKFRFDSFQILVKMGDLEIYKYREIRSI